MDIAIQFAWGLHSAHEQGLIHQDVKPANVLMTPEGTAKVTDFGLAQAKSMKAAGAANGTMIVDGVGYTPAYASPEQTTKQTLTRRTDLWSWAVSVLDMFMGRQSCQSGGTAGVVLEEVYLAEGPESPNLPTMPDAVIELLKQCFEENPEKRLHDLKEAAERLQVVYRRVTGNSFFRPEPKIGLDTAGSLNNRALSLLDLNNRQEAEETWAQAKRIDPNNLEVIYNRGLMLWRSGSISDEVLVQSLEDIRRAGQEQNFLNYYLACVYF